MNPCAAAKSLWSRPSGLDALQSVRYDVGEMTLDELVRSKRVEILRISAEHGARNVRIFGSVARGESDSESDVDVLVELEAGRSLLDHAALLLDLEKLLGCRVDVVTERGLRPRIRERILKEAVPL